MITNNFANTLNKNNYNNYSNYNQKVNNKKEECHTCENRRYKDGSDDPSVSFKTATKISPGSASQAVRSHEQEHVSHEKSKANKEGREIVSQTVTIKTSTCPECGKAYVSGGETKTVTRNKTNLDDEARRGQFIDKYI